MLRRIHYKGLHFYTLIFDKKAAFFSCLCYFNVIYSYLAGHSYSPKQYKLDEIHMRKVIDFIETLESNQKEIAYFINKWLITEFNLEAKYRFKIPFYYQNTWICYLNPIKKDGIEFNFVRARELSNFDTILDFRGRKMVAGIKLFDVQKIPTAALAEVLEEAILLDETIPYSFKKSGK